MKNNQLVFKNALESDLSRLNEQIPLGEEKTKSLINYAVLLENTINNPFKKLLTTIFTSIICFLVGTSTIFLFFMNRSIDNYLNAVFILSLIIYIVPGLIIYFVKSRQIGITSTTFGTIMLTIVSLIYGFDEPGQLNGFIILFYLLLLAGIYLLERLSIKLFYSLLVYAVFITSNIIWIKDDLIMDEILYITLSGYF